MPTTHHTLGASWTQIATTPCAVDLRAGTAMIHHGDSAPAVDTEAYHRLSDHDGNWLSYGGAENTYARAGGASAEIVVTPGS